MRHYVYIIQTQTDGSYYKGYSKQPIIRMGQHNNGESLYTSTKLPWKLVYVEELHTELMALQRERNLKKATVERIEALIKHRRNLLIHVVNNECD